MSFFNELRRRNVLRVAAGYIVAAWLVVQVVETIFPAFGFGDEAVRFVVIAFAVGFVPVVVLAWVFEWTPEGIKKDEGDERRGTTVTAAAKRWDRVVMVVLALAVTFFIVENILERPVDVEPTVAVLPFAGTGLDPELEYLSAGVPQAVHSSLARIPELVVSAWPTIVALSNEGLDAAAIAAKLKAPNFLAGTVQSAGDQVRVTARLVATDSGRTIWTETFDGAIADVFAIQDEIAAAVATGLRIGQPGSLPRTQRTNAETYQLTTQAWSLLHRARSENVGSITMGLLDRALALDPDYISALNATQFAAFYQQMDGTISADESDAIHRGMQERVLAIDPDNGVVNVYMAWGLFWDEKEVAHANQHLQTALRTGLNDLEVLRVLAGFARRTGNADAAIWFGERALTVDPTCENCRWQTTENLFYAGRFEEAIEGKKRLQELGFGGHYNHAVMLLMNGDSNEALEIIADSTDPVQKSGIRAMAYNVSGDTAKFAENVAALNQMDGPYPLGTLAQVYAFSGDTDRTFETLDRWIEEGGMPDRHLFLPQWENLRDDPRWAKLRERLDMTEAQVSMLDFSRVTGGAAL